jgi:DHA2 family multidrug resistance protein
MAAAMGVTICQFLDMTIANVALPHMRTSLGASQDQITWVLTSFIMAGAMVVPLTAWLSERVGSRNLFVWATGGFLVSSMLCGAAASLTQMVIFRALQGIASAFMGPLSQTLIYDIMPPSKQARGMAIWGMVVMIAPITGPFIGATLTEQLNWRWVFYVNLPIGIPALAILWWQLPSRPVVRRSLDLYGLAFLAIALGALQLGLDRGESKEWFDSWEIKVEFLVAIAGFWMFVVQSRFIKQPLFPAFLWRNANFVIALGFMMILGVANVALASILPTMFQSLYRYDVMHTGILMAPRGMGVFCTMLLANRLVGKIDSRAMISAGYLVAAISMWMMTRWSLVIDEQTIVTAGFIQGLGLGLVFVPMNMVAFGTLSPAHRPDGATLMTLFRNLGSSVGISVITTMFARNLQTSHADVGAHITANSLPAIDPAATAMVFGAAGDALLTMVDGEVNRQAAMIAYIDNFYAMFWVLLFFSPLAWLLRKPKQIMLDQTLHMD